MYANTNMCTHTQTTSVLCSSARFTLEPCQLSTLLDTKHGAPVCCWCMLMCHIHLFVCLIWILLVPSHVPAPPTPPSPPLAHIHTSRISRSSSSASSSSPSSRCDIRAFVCLDCSQLAGGSGWGGGVGPPPLAVRMQIGLVLIKRQLHISLKPPAEVGKEKVYLSGEAKVV